MYKLIKALTFLILFIGLVGWFFWPKEWAVKGPVVDFLTGNQIDAPDEDTLHKRFSLPDGFGISVFAQGVNNARMMRITNKGDVLVSMMRPGDVVLLHRDENSDGVADGRTVLFSGLDLPHGLAIQDDYIYVAETGRIVRAKFDSEKRTVGAVEQVFEGLPSGGNHRTRTLGFGPEGWLYVTVGSSCNACIEDHPYRAAMLRMRPDGSDVNVYATGLRNTVGFDWHPGSGVLYGTDNGRDLLGDDIPHCEINLIEEGQFYGWPYTFDNKVGDPDYGAGHEEEIAGSRKMVHGLGAHVAPLGIRFLKADKAPPGYENVALAALHGSWNRSRLSGYKVVALRFADDGTVSEEDFLTGFERDEDVIGRPVDVEQGPDGAIYVSDDYAGVIYRVTWGDTKVGVSALPEKMAVDPFATVDAENLAVLTASGGQVFAANACAQCHDPSAVPDGVQVKILKGLSSRYDVPALQALLDAPSGPMPRPDISDEERRALSVYLLQTY